MSFFLEDSKLFKQTKRIVGSENRFRDSNELGKPKDSYRQINWGTYNMFSNHWYIRVYILWVLLNVFIAELSIDILKTFSFRFDS